ncbi:unnamed protein product [Linum trigynum]
MLATILVLSVALWFGVISTATAYNLCHEEERSSLLKFTQDFTIKSDVETRCRNKLQSWMASFNCCDWDGVDCDESSGHIIGLDLSSSCLHGSINSSSTHFHLPQLRRLNLANNNFNHSPVPSAVARLTHLESLNLSSASFSARIPPSISQLSKIVVLDLSDNDNLVLGKYAFVDLIRNSTRLQHLNLGSVNMSVDMSSTHGGGHDLVNLTSLEFLNLSNCGLYGELPSTIFHLPNLQLLSLGLNLGLKGQLVEDFNSTSPLQSLDLHYTNFSGTVPTSIGNLASLSAVNLWHCAFHGTLPVSLGNLTNLAFLSLSKNNFEPHDFSFFSWIGKRTTNLYYLGLSYIPLVGDFPTYLANLTNLSHLYMHECHISGQFPSTSIFALRHLQQLGLSSNNLTGALDFNDFLDLQSLDALSLTGNLNISLLFFFNDTSSITTTHHRKKFIALDLGSCNIGRFPEMLRHENELVSLDLSNNNIHGEIPEWLWSANQDSLEYIDLSGNFLTGFEGPTVSIITGSSGSTSDINASSRPSSLVVPWTKAKILRLGSNLLQGNLPIPPPSIQHLDLSNNELEGEIWPDICSIFITSHPSYLDLSHNNLSGRLLPCLGSQLSASLELLKLDGNKFTGEIPQPYLAGCNLKVLVLGDNLLAGEVPKSLANCTRLEFLILGNNQINDTFPYYLGALPQLQVLILRGNLFHGAIIPAGGKSRSNTSTHDFARMQIIDLSSNYFTGQLPSNYFLNWDAMKGFEAETLAYLQLQTGAFLSSAAWYLYFNFWYTMTLTNKGTVTTYAKIMHKLVAVDLSDNRFQGEIPAAAVGNLAGLRLLNLSNNLLTGPIPPSLGRLSRLESLDVTRNKLDGSIPQELTQLNFLAVFNVSCNQLVGAIPRGNQFGTFLNDSYGGNVGLCGTPLSRMCANGSSETEDAGGSPTGYGFEFGWEPVLMGYGSGTVVGIVIGYVVVSRNYHWFLRTLRVGGRRKGRRSVRTFVSRYRH